MAISTLLNAVMHWASGTFSSKDATRRVEATADAAQASADLANRVAKSAQSTAEAALPYADVYTSHQAVYEWDGSTDGRDTFVHNGHTYCKISDDVFAFDSVTAATSVNTVNTTIHDLYDGENCFKAGGAIVVTHPGKCKLALIQNHSVMGEFTAPSAGVYLYKTTSGLYALGLTLDYKTATFARSSDLTSLATRVDALEGAGGGGAGAFVVNVSTTDGQTFTADKTFAETVGALQAGQAAEVHIQMGTISAVVNVMSYTSSEIVFSNATVTDTTLSIAQIRFSSDESIQYNVYTATVAKLF